MTTISCALQLDYCALQCPSAILPPCVCARPRPLSLMSHTALPLPCWFYHASSHAVLPCLLLHICHEFERFSEFMANVKVGTFFGGVNITKNEKQLKKNTPAIVVGTPGRIKQVGWHWSVCLTPLHLLFQIVVVLV